MEYTQIHDYLITNEHNLSAHHLHFLAWLKAHANFLVGIEKYFLMLRDELSEFVHKENNVVNKELIDDYANIDDFDAIFFPQEADFSVSIDKYILEMNIDSEIYLISEYFFMN